MSESEVVALLASHGVNFTRQDKVHGGLWFEEDGITFRIVWGFDWHNHRWHAGLSHIDTILRRAQA